MSEPVAGGAGFDDLSGEGQAVYDRGSLLDRLLHHCHTVVTNGDSYRMKQARTRGGPPTKKK